MSRLLWRNTEKVFLDYILLLYTVPDGIQEKGHLQPS